MVTETSHSIHHSTKMRAHRHISRRRCPTLICTWHRRTKLNKRYRCTCNVGSLSSRRAFPERRSCRVHKSMARGRRFTNYVNRHGTNKTGHYAPEQEGEPLTGFTDSGVISLTTTRVCIFQEFSQKKHHNLANMPCKTLENICCVLLSEPTHRT